ncbi:hypothetical protein RclHR1_18420001 [Rhizophagus clarus]|uniref:Uncharacterized protein n=1 Tax=Rhizophagus clarus TaxID=94130 RepID=A0A2Z6QZT2_9GLOM|nr:hypothetical protein RclHR1_18420001 [Rhizophagus clarus]GES98805.1 hypothetical protein RCL_e6021_RclHR1_18420001 [Rhizophagus clarus]
MDRTLSCRSVNQIFTEEKYFIFIMKKGFLLTNPASKTIAMSSTTKVTPTTALKSIPSDHFHDVIVDFISGLIKRNPLTVFSSIITTDLSAIDKFLSTYKEQIVPINKLS